MAAEAERLLLVRLSGSSPVFAPGLWHLPGGGIDPGEQPADALVREVREETGLTPVSVRLLDARTYTARRGGARWSLTALFYAMDLAAGTLVAESNGSCEAAAWVPRAELCDAVLSPPAAHALRLLDAGRVRPEPVAGRRGPSQEEVPCRDPE
jgi:8-oxo-dGTP pyrophosphatase MutT (NUDIX family)